LGEDFAINLDEALKKNFAICTNTPACKQRFGDPMQTLYQLRDALRANPHKVSFRDPQTYATVQRPLNEYSLAGVVRMFAYESETSALLPLSINAAAHGDVGPLLGQAKLLNGDLSGDMNNGMSMSVICSEDADLLQERPQDEHTILGNQLIRALKAQCEVWPHGTRPADFHTPLKSDKPILVLDGEFDPVTPPSYGAQIVSGLGNARQLVLKGQGHAVLGRGCMPRLIGKFVDKLSPKQLDASCLDKLGPTPAYINFNGAAP
jgi:pimeloyl-ACP methyl ester carboxylesterase